MKKNIVKIFTWFFVFFTISYQNCDGKSFYVEYDEEENDGAHNSGSKTTLDSTTLQMRGGGLGNAESPSEGNLMSSSGLGDPLDPLKMSRGDMNDLKIGSSPWMVDETGENMADRMSLSNYRQLNRKSSRPYGRLTFPYDTNNFRSWSKQKNFFGGGGPKKRQSILYRQCFFNPISCF